MADGVRAGERDHVFGVEALGGESALERLEVGEGPRQEVGGLGGEGHAAVEAAGGHREVEPAVAEEGGRVAGGEGDDVRARHDAGAGRLERRLGPVDHAEAAKALSVGWAQHLRRVAGAARVHEENGSIATLKNNKNNV